MSLTWIKLHVAVIDNDDFKRLSSRAKLTFYTALALAGKQDKDGALAARSGPMTTDEIAGYTGLTRAHQDDALDQLSKAGFLVLGLDGAWRVERWDEKAGSESSKTSNAERQRRYRERYGVTSRNADSNALRVTEIVTDIDKDVDRDIIALRRNAASYLLSPNYDALRTSALSVGKWPENVAGLRSLAVTFVAVFGNCADPVKAEKHLGPYTNVLAVLRSRGVTIAQGWQACVDARAANGDKPLFGASVKNAISYLPGWAKAPAAPKANDRGEEFDRKAAAANQRKLDAIPRSA